MRQVLLAVLIVAAAACVDVPDSVHAQFAPPTPAERTNYRPGRHGAAPPVEDPAPAVAPKAAETAVTSGALDAGAGPPVTATATDDGGGAP
jgi:hypothetical protein